MEKEPEWKKAYRLTIYLSGGQLAGYVNDEKLCSWLSEDKGFLYAEVGNRLIVKEQKYRTRGGKRDGIVGTHITEYVNATYRIEPTEEWSKEDYLW